MTTGNGRATSMTTGGHSMGSVGAVRRAAWLALALAAAACSDDAPETRAVGGDVPALPGTGSNAISGVAGDGVGASGGAAPGASGGNAAMGAAGVQDGAGGMSAAGDASGAGGGTPAVVPVPSGSGVVPTSPTCDGADCWTYLGRDLHSTYFNSLETRIGVDTVAQLQPLWTAELGSAASGTAAVVGDSVYFMASNNTRAFDRATGAMRWEVAGGGSGSITFDAGKLYMQRPNGDILRLDAATGALEWTFAGSDRSNSIGTPLVVGNEVLVGTSSSDEFATFGSSNFVGRVWAIDKDTGQELWHHLTVQGPGDGAPVWSSPSADPELGMAFFTSGNNYYTAGGDSNSIFALDLATGAKAWSFQALANDVFNGSLGANGLDHDFGANPILFEAAGRKLVGAGAKSGTFYAVDRLTGELAWSRNLTDGCRLGGILNNGAYDGTRIYVASFPCTSFVMPFPLLMPGTPVVAALDPATGEVLWQQAMQAQSWAPITVANGVVFVPSNTTLNALNAATGEMLWSYPTAGSICSAAAVVDGQVFFGSGLPSADAFGLAGATDGTTLHALALP